LSKASDAAAAKMNASSDSEADYSSDAPPPYTLLYRAYIPSAHLLYLSRKYINVNFHQESKVMRLRRLIYDEQPAANTPRRILHVCVFLLAFDRKPSRSSHDKASDRAEGDLSRVRVWQIDP
jgi:hypothetical protein